MPSGWQHERSKCVFVLSVRFVVKKNVITPEACFRKGCKQHSFVKLKFQSSQPTLSYRVGVIVFVKGIVKIQ